MHSRQNRHIPGQAAPRAPRATGWLALISAILLALGVAPAAQAAPITVIGGGSGILLPDYYEEPGLGVLCTLTAIGYNGQRGLVGMTAGHCGNPGQRVFSEAEPDHGSLGQFYYTSNNVDVSMIDFDDAVVRPTRTIDKTTIDGFAPAPPFGSIVCKQGRTTGHTCGIIWGQLGDEVIEHTCSIHGDSGGPVTYGNKVVSFVSWGPPPDCYSPFPSPFHGPDFGVSMVSAINDVNAHAGGFALF